MMNNSAALYLASDDRAAVAAALGAALAAQGFQPAALPPGAGGGKIMIPEKRRRLFFLAPPAAGWVAIWEDPRYFADRRLARSMAAAMQTRGVWIEVGGNGVSWARGLYAGETVVEERYEEVETTFYGEYGVIHLAFDAEVAPEEWIAEHGLPDAGLHYEALLEGAAPSAGPALHLAFERL